MSSDVEDFMSEEGLPDDEEMDDFDPDDDAYDDYDFGGSDDEYGDYGEFGFDEEVPREKEKNYTVLKPEDIVKQQIGQINQIAELFEIPSPSARLLLNHFGWNTDKLIERFYDGDAEKLFKESGIQDPRASGETSDAKQKKGDGEVECSICLMDSKQSEMLACAACNVEFCPDCWKLHITTNINDGKVKVIRCPAKGCISQIDAVTINSLLGDDEGSKQKYAKLVADAYVMDNPNVRYCPSPGCDRAIKVELLKDKHVVCDCSCKFCFGCGKLPHAPAECGMARKWEQKIAKEGEDAQWLAAFTKECPKCATLIHKDGGCQYMACPKCSHKFCWICLGNFDHKNHQCNKFTETSGDDKRKDLHKFMHFLTRYQTHEQSAKLEDKLMEIAERIMHELAEKGMSWIDVQFIKTATEQLTEARDVLKWTYVYGYFLPDQVNRELFEYLQGELEEGTEKLSELLEAKGEKDRMNIINQNEFVKQRLQNLLEGLAEGDITGGDNTVKEKTYKTEGFEKYNGWIYNAGS
mmetsp:Transcript_3584/g.3960  ORF Transcript_3584/g.3960 Transcript_3584/m.3960 type:complete len:523 (-) Transcript_3584:184-1752(-)